MTPPGLGPEDGKGGPDPRERLLLDTARPPARVHSARPLSPPDAHLKGTSPPPPASFPGPGGNHSVHGVRCELSVQCLQLLPGGEVPAGTPGASSGKES